MELLIGALLLSLGAVAFRRAARWQRRARLHRTEGRSPERAMRVDRFDELDALVTSSRCACGGRLKARSEGTRRHGERELRVVHTECDVCEEPLDLFFERRPLLH